MFVRWEVIEKRAIDLTGQLKIDKRRKKTRNMLAAFFRNAFLIGILAWYSLSVWKMIDGYFRDQFASYLHEEYRKNPRMKSDVRDMNAVDKEELVVTEVETVLDKMVELEPEDYSDDNLDADKKVEVSVESKLEENQVVENVTEKKLEIKENFTNEEPIQEKPNNQKPKKEEPKNEETIVVKKKKLTLKRKEEEVPKKVVKKRVKTITFKEEDFLSVKKRRGMIERDEDFWEFDEDQEEGIPISQLPYKPRLDVGRLERITADEYCPLTLEDELSCGETTEWP